MIKYFSFVVFFIITFKCISQEVFPQVVSGKITRVENFKSNYITKRNIDIWFPEGYSDTTKYAVLYMHDGQMLFDSSITWNKQAWEIDAIATELIFKGKVKPFIVVGIWNDSKTRHKDYFPEKPFKKLKKIEKDSINAQLKRSGRTVENFKPNSDNYLKFIVKELKPFIDKTFSVKGDNENTSIMGSSMGGLISFYAMCEYPDVFTSAACLSTHWPGTFTLENNPIPSYFYAYLSKKLPSPKTHKIYFDCGDQTLDALYPPIQKRIDELIIEKGFDERNWKTNYFPGEDHSEKAWSKRLSIPLEFLFGF